MQGSQTDNDLFGPDEFMSEGASGNCYQQSWMLSIKLPHPLPTPFRIEATR